MLSNGMLPYWVCQLISLTSYVPEIENTVKVFYYVVIAFILHWCFTEKSSVRKQSIDRTFEFVISTKLFIDSNMGNDT